MTLVEINKYFDVALRGPSKTTFKTTPFVVDSLGSYAAIGVKCEVEGRDGVMRELRIEINDLKQTPQETIAYFANLICATASLGKALDYCSTCGRDY